MVLIDWLKCPRMHHSAQNRGNSRTKILELWQIRSHLFCIQNDIEYVMGTIGNPPTLGKIEQGYYTLLKYTDTKTSVYQWKCKIYGRIIKYKI